MDQKISEQLDSAVRNETSNEILENKKNDLDSLWKITLSHSALTLSQSGLVILELIVRAMNCSMEAVNCSISYIADLNEKDYRELVKLSKERKSDSFCTLTEKHTDAASEVKDVETTPHQQISVSEASRENMTSKIFLNFRESFEIPSSFLDQKIKEVGQNIEEIIEKQMLSKCPFPIIECWVDPAEIS